MGLFNKQKDGGILDVIRCDEESYLIWKWHPKGSVQGENVRENTIRWGSSLRVKDGTVAVFVYKQKDGTMEDFIEGPFDQIIKTANFPVLSTVLGLVYDGTTPFQAEVYFINMAKAVQIKFAVPYFDITDPRYTDFGVPTAVRGTLTFRIADYREFIKIHRLENFNLDDFKNKVKDSIIDTVKSTVANAPNDYAISVVQIEQRIGEINRKIEYVLSERLRKSFGVDVTDFAIASIDIDKGSEGYRELMKVTKEVVSETIMAKTAINIKDMQDKQRIEAENYAETLRIQREEGQYAQHMHTQSVNIAAYQVEKQAEVGVAGAEALGQMGANNAGNVQLGGDSGVGFNPAAMMTSIAMGSVVGQNMAGLMSNAMSGINQQPQSAMVPPPIPQTMYNVAINGQAAGPFNMDTLKEMALGGQLTSASLVWKPGMTAWATADTIEELNSVLVNVMPPIS